MQITYLTLLPPILVLIAAFITKKIKTSLFLGIFSAALISNNYGIKDTLTSIFSRFYDQFKDIDNYYFFSLIFILGIIIALITKTGGAQALGDIIIKKAKSRKDAETSTLLLSTCLFIDDYLNSLTVGYVMRPLTAKFNIPRVKLAYLIGVMAGSLVVIMPISSWVGMLIGQLSLSGISLDPAAKPIILADSFFVYLKSIPFIFYSFIMIASTWFIVRRRISYGPMHQFEKIAKETGNLFGGKFVKEEILESTKTTHSILDFFLPILILIFSVIIGIPYVGGYYLFGGTNTLIQSFQYSNASLVLCIASALSLIISLIFALIRKKIKIFDTVTITKNGIEMMFASVVTIIFAWVFGSFLKQDLKTGIYLADLLLGIVNIHILPLMIYLTSIIIALAIGSSWGTIAILVPIVVPMVLTFLNIPTPTLFENVILLLPCIGAIFSGSITGNHLSPISDSTIMASTSTGAHIIDLVKARFYYVIPSVIATSISFLIIGFLINKNIYLALTSSILAGILISFGLLLFMQKIFRRS